MQYAEGTWAVWIVWAMLLTGAGLILASLWQASERFWYWKQARQLAAGEVAQATAALCAGQRFRIAAGEDKAAATSAFPREGHTAAGLVASASVADTIFGEPEASIGSEMTGRIIGMSRGLLLLLLEPETITRDERGAIALRNSLRVGQTLALQVTGDSELFRFEATVRSVRPDPEQPLCTQIAVKLPFWLARIQRRRHVRASIHSGAAVQMTDNPGSIGNNRAKENVNNVLRGTLRDLSGSGLCLELDSVLRPDTIARLCEQWDRNALLKCRLNLPLLRDEPLKLRVHSCERIVVRGGLGLRVRGEFVELPAWQQETIISLVFQAQRQQLRQQTPRLQTAV